MGKSYFQEEVNNIISIVYGVKLLPLQKGYYFSSPKRILKTVLA
jgi:hypothetical protein